MSVISSVALYALCSPVWAFAPAGDPDADDIVNLEPTRILYQHPEEQARMLEGARWKSFVATDGRGWNARFDEATGTPRWMWGGGIPMPVSSEQELTHALEALLHRHSELLGFTPGSLSLARASYVPSLDTWYVDFDTLRDDLPTYRGGISARIKRGNLIFLRVSTAPRARLTGAIALGAAEAVQRAIEGGPAPDAHHTERSARPILLERYIDGELVLRKTWMVRTVTGRRAGSATDAPGIWVTFVDGQTGELLNVHNEVRSATIEAEHHERTVDGSPLVTSGVPYAYVGNNSDLAVTDEDGVYTISGGGPYATELSGEYVTVYNDDGAEGYLSESDPDMTWTDNDATQAEIDSYIFLHEVKIWGDATAPDVPWVGGPIESYVNVDSTCNAYFDGAVNFFDAGSGCNNTGQIADVNYHEWGHGFHYYSIESGDFDGSLSEGAGDTVSILITNDRYIAPYFGTSGWAIRDLAPDQVYPQDFINNDYYVHYNGLIFGGAMYDLRNLLQDDQGDELGAATTSQIFAGLLKGGPTIPDAYYEAVVADDDDGDLSNGTPHICQIQDAFSRHGLGEGASSGASGVLVTHDPLENQPEGEDHEVSVELVELSGGCQATGAEDAIVSYREGGKGGWDEAPLSTSGTSVEGAIPEQPEYSFVEYYISGTTDDGTPFSSPFGERINPYTFFVGDTLEIRCDDFEEDDGNYKHDLIDGTDEEGADDWQWGTPTGVGGDPSGAYSGSKAWGNDLGGAGYNGLYKPGKGNRLRSPKIDTTHYEGVFLSYRRWLQVEDGVFDQALITVDDEVVWSNWEGDESEHHLDGQWMNHAVDLQGYADRDEIRIGFELHSDEGAEFGGWTIDDVCLLAPATPDNRLGITDFEVEAMDKIHARLTFTAPSHRPLEEIRVVRRTDDFPEDYEDGDIAWEDDDVELGEEVEIEDKNGYAGRTYYAVFASDGDDWLSWVIEDWNAASVKLDGGNVKDEWWKSQDDGGKMVKGCGCSGAPSAQAAAPWLLALSLAPLMRRNRRETGRGK